MPNSLEIDYNRLRPEAGGGLVNWKPEGDSEVRYVVFDYSSVLMDIVSAIRWPSTCPLCMSVASDCNFVHVGVDENFL